MSKLGKALLVLVGFSLIVGGLSNFILPDFKSYLWVPFAVAAIFFLIEVAIDFRIYKEFLTLKTTKHGTNMGVMILLVMALLGVVNFIAIKRNKKWDLTQEKVNSLSAQTTKLVKGLSDDLQILAFFREETPEEANLKFQFKEVTDLMRDESPKVKVQFINAIKNPDLVKENNVMEAPSVILKYKGKTTAITELNEESVANAIVKVTRERNKILYYLTGHGEVDLEDTRDGKGGGFYKKSLTDSSYDVSKLSLIENPKIPDNADAILIIGPKQALLEPEQKLLEDYARRGGNLFVAVDPGQKHNLGPWLKKFGVKFDNNYIIDQVGQLVGQSAAVAIGMQYSNTSEITKLFVNQITAFDVASSIERDPSAPADFHTDEIVKSSPASFAKPQLSTQVSFNDKVDKKGPLTLAMTVAGSLNSSKVEGAKKETDNKEKKSFSMVVFGDSDFLTNRMMPVQLNRDLAVNSVAFLAKDHDLISIKPKQLATTRIAMTQTQASLLVYGIYLPIPVILLILAGVVWFRRRGA